MATIAQPPPVEQAPEPPRRVQAVRARAHVEHVGEEVAPPRFLERLLVFLAGAGFYFWVGYTVIVHQDVVVFDALDRLTRAYMVWHNEPPKLAAIGFVFPPLTTVALLPFAIVKPVATSLVALPLTSSLFGGWMLVGMNRLFARCSMSGLRRWSLLALFGLNPLIVFYAGNGMSEIVYLAVLTFTLQCFISWFVTAQPRFLIAAALAFAVLAMLRYSFGIWALLISVMIALGLKRRGAENDEIEGTLITFLAPLVYALSVWTLFNWLIVGDPLSWLRDSGDLAVNAPQSGTTGSFDVLDALARTGELTLGVFGLGIVVVPALILAAITKRDQVSAWLVALALLAVVVNGADALLQQDLDPLALRNALPVLVVCVAGMAWLHRILPGMRTLIWLGGLVGLALTAFGSWVAMQHYPFQGQEQAFARAVKTGEGQNGTNSIGGYRVGVRPEAQMAAYINSHVDGRSTILADNAQTFGVIALSGRPGVFFDRVDRGDGTFQQVVVTPYGRVRYLLVAKQVSGDVIRRRYPTAAIRAAAGFVPVAETERYVLLAVPARDPRRPRSTGATGGAPAVGGGRVGGVASAADPATRGGEAP